ncbi:YkgJ family cysteine cluster protein [Puteibacter caeruleilacunae]|nr:YkgJ family cysteine cluster protein [Puteibacter caeruleilacunae]
MKNEEALKRYHEIRDKIDEHCSKLYGEHQSAMKCAKGCSECCMNFDVFPVELYSIQQALKDYTPTSDQLTPTNSESCIFLKDKVCTIYEARPVICRTHGYPLLYMNDENWELSYCPLNFEDQEPDYFHLENTYPQDRYNSELFLANKAFIESIPGNPFSEFDLIPMNQIFQTKLFEK